MSHRLTADRWITIRQQYETDPRLSFADLASNYGVSKQAIHKRATAENWLRVVSMAELAAHAQTKADYLVDGKVDAEELCSIRKSGIEEATSRRAAVLERHRKETDGPRKIVHQAIQIRDIELAKLAKTLAESLKIIHELERKAWGLEVTEQADNHVIVIERS